MNPKPLFYFVGPKDLNPFTTTVTDARLFTQLKEVEDYLNRFLQAGKRLSVHILRDDGTAIPAIIQTSTKVIA